MKFEFAGTVPGSQKEAFAKANKVTASKNKFSTRTSGWLWLANSNSNVHILVTEMASTSSAVRKAA